MPGRKKRGSRNLKIMLSAMGITVLALLILALAAYLLIGGKADEQAKKDTAELAKQYRQERRVSRLIRKQM